MAEAEERTGDLFSRRASDNAEVVPDDAPRTPDALWSTEHVFSAEPVARDDDVLDEALDEPPGSGHFGLGAEADPASEPLWRDLPPPETSGRPDWSSLTDDTPDDPPAPTPPPPSAPSGRDPDGFDDAVAALDDEQRARAAVPLAVVGALLSPTEQVVGLLTGSMLGAAAVVALTGERVIVVNDRRWRPVVDEYSLGRQLQVRGRSDRGVAALSISDDERLSMVDGIVDVAGAAALAARIRASGRP